MQTSIIVLPIHLLIPRDRNQGPWFRYRHRPILPLHRPRRPSRHRVAIIHRPGGVMSQKGFPAYSREHSLSNLISLSISLVSYLFLWHNLRGAFLPARGKGCLFQRPRHDLDLREAGGGWFHIPPLCMLLTALAENSPGHPPVVQNHIPGTQIHSPENSRKN